jgi:hypothetical protein
MLVKDLREQLAGLDEELEVFILSSDVVAFDLHTVGRTKHAVALVMGWDRSIFPKVGLPRWADDLETLLIRRGACEGATSAIHKIVFLGGTETEAPREASRILESWQRDVEEYLEPEELPVPYRCLLFFRHAQHLPEWTLKARLAHRALYPNSSTMRDIFRELVRLDVTDKEVPPVAREAVRRNRHYLTKVIEYLPEPLQEVLNAW